VAELADARDLKSLDGQLSCRFDSGQRHHEIKRLPHFSHLKKSTYFAERFYPFFFLVRAGSGHAPSLSLGSRCFPEDRPHSLKHRHPRCRLPCHNRMRAASNSLRLVSISYLDVPFTMIGSPYRRDEITFYRMKYYTPVSITKTAGEVANRPTGRVE
jgi:hypothetical protein